VEIQRFPAIPGVELWTAKARAPLWTCFRWGYAFCWGAEATSLTCRGLRVLLGPADLIVTGPGDLPLVTARGRLLRAVVVSLEALAGAAGAHPLPSELLPLAPLAAPSLRKRLEGLDETASDQALAGAIEEAAAWLRELAVRAPAAPRIADHRLNRARRMIEDGHTETCSLDELARVAEVSKFYLSRKFKAAFGLLPRRLLRRIRLAAALEQIRAGRRPCDVATDVGFVDQAHFTRAFHEEVGLTPGRYARSAPDSPRGTLTRTA
jgi:AraC-like DNA-binding protein